MPEEQNITTIAQSRLCNTCGACSGVCPSEAIHYKETLGGYYLPVVDEETCIECGLCLEVCPGAHFGETLKSNLPQDPFAGNALEAFVGKATNKQLFENSQSGGIVSALLVHTLETGRIRGAVTVGMQSGAPPRPEVRIAKTANEIQQAQKSKYCPVPVLGFLRELDRYDGPVAVVGTSCQIHGLKNVLDKKPKLQEKIAFCIGLVCERVLTYSALDFLLSKAKMTNNQNSSILHFKDKAVSGYPGDVHVFSDNGKSVVMLAKTRMLIKDYFTPARCRLCFDKMNVFSDISVGDPHGLEGVDRKMGESMLVARTDSGLEIINAAKDAGAINIRPTEYAQVLKGQGIDKKRQQWRGYVEAWKQMGNTPPDYYEQVKNHAPNLGKLQKYVQDLKYSLDLDRFSSREELIQQEENKLKKKQLINGLLYPLRLPRRVVRKMSNLVSRGQTGSNKAKPMLIEIRKAAFVNKGAELMLRSIVAKLRDELPQARLVMVPPKNYDSYLERGELGLYQKIGHYRYGIQWGHLGRIIPAKLRQLYGMVLDSEIDVVLDASGFSYGDQWGDRSCIEPARALKRWKKQGTRVVFMPQAFGPFSIPKIKQDFKKMAESVDLMYARDEVSYRYVTDLVGERDNIRMYPDFTNLISGEVPEEFNIQDNRFCIIPNYQMIAKTTTKDGANYIPFLITCARHLQEQDAKPFILIHEGEKDQWLGQQVAKGLDQEINIVQETHALRIKGVIGVSDGVISSRFHGLVSALSQGVPALATGWSHKYEMLFQDYGFPEGMLGVDASPAEIHDKIDLLILEVSKQRIRDTLMDASQVQKQASSRMWDEVLGLIHGKNV